MKTKLVCVVGPTSSGKTALGLRLAKQFFGEIVNADARQMYQGTTIGTGKPAGQWVEQPWGRAYMVDDVPHHLMDVYPVTQNMSVAEWRAAARERITAIQARGHLPLVVGGTGLYIRALVEAYDLPPGPADTGRRAQLSGLSLGELVERLRALDPAALTLVDVKNSRRVTRAIELVEQTGQSLAALRRKGGSLYDTLLIARFWPAPVLRQRIEQSVDEMLARGWLEEVRRLLAEGVSLQAPALTSIGYADLAAVLRGEQSLDEARKNIKLSTWHYARRQLTWWRRDQTVTWVQTEEEAMEIVKNWLSEPS